jgi:hypothetical protein
MNLRKPIKLVTLSSGAMRIYTSWRLLVCVAGVVCFAAATACAPLLYCDLASIEGGCRGPYFENARLVVEDQESLHPSSTIWLGAGETLIAYWDTLTSFNQLGDETCDFSNLTEATPECNICDFCLTEEERQLLCPTGRLKPVENIKIAAYEGFLTSEMPVLAAEPHPLGGCSADGYQPASFTPTVNATYQFRNTVRINGTLREYAFFDKQVFVLNDATTQTTNYPLAYYVNDPNNAQKVWYSWTIGTSELWQDNYSNKLRVRGIRVLTGRVGTHPITGRFHLFDARPVRPSRVVFLPDFVAGQPHAASDILSPIPERSQRCYADEFTLDGDIDLTRCRLVFGGSTPSGNPPIYTASPIFYDGKQLTWFVEFNEFEKGDFDPNTPQFDPVPADAVLAIEFTIENP